MVQPIENLDLATLLKIQQMAGFTRNLSTSSKMWDYISKKKKTQSAEGRFLRYLVINSLGYAAAQALPADGSGAYPRASRSKPQEAQAHYKEWAWTVNVPRVLLNKQGPEAAQYAEAMGLELENKQIAFARLKSIELHGDGSGVIGVVTAISVVNGKFVVTVSNASADAGRSFIRWFQQDDHVKFATTAGVAHNTVATGTTAAYLNVDSIDEVLSQVTLTPYSVTDVAQTAVAAQFNLAVGDVIYRKGAALSDLTAAGIAAGTVDFESLNHSMVGLEALAANNGIKVHGLVKSGNLAGSVTDCSGQLISLAHFQSAISQAKRRAGEGRYKYSEAFMSDAVYDSLIAANEADRRLVEVDNVKRGFKSMGFLHRGDSIAFCSDEFIPDQRIRLLPDSKDALAFVGGMPEQVAPNGSDKYRLSITADSAGQEAYGRENTTSFEQQGVLITKHAAPIITIKNYAVSNVG